MIVPGIRRRGELSSLLKWAIVIVGAIVVLGLFLGIQSGLFDTLTATLDKRFGNILVGLGG